MTVVSMILSAAGGLIGLIAAIWFLVKAFQESVWWGLGCLFIAPVGLVFLIMHWDVAKKPFLVSVVAGVLGFVGVLLAPKEEVDISLTRAEVETFHAFAQM